MLTCEPLGQVAVAARQGDKSALLGDRGPGGVGVGGGSNWAQAGRAVGCSPEAGTVESLSTTRHEHEGARTRFRGIVACIQRYEPAGRVPTVSVRGEASKAIPMRRPRAPRSGLSPLGLRHPASPAIRDRIKHK